jgi:hypothetical protein
MLALGSSCTEVQPRICCEIRAVTMSGSIWFCRNRMGGFCCLIRIDDCLSLSSVDFPDRGERTLSKHDAHVLHYVFSDPESIDCIFVVEIDELSRSGVRDVFVEHEVFPLA